MRNARKKMKVHKTWEKMKARQARKKIKARKACTARRHVAT